MMNFLKYFPKNETYDFELPFEKNVIYEKNKKENILVSDKIEKNLNYVKQVMHLGINGDIIIRKFNLLYNDNKVKCFLVCVDGLTNSESINEFILEPLFKNRYSSLKNEDITDIRFYSQDVITQFQLSYKRNILDITDNVNIGNIGIFIDGCNNAVLIDAKSWEHRGVDSAINEAVVLGPHEAFNEVLRTNSALIRKSVKSSDLVFENFEFGKISKTPGSLAYIDGKVNPKMLNLIKEKINGIYDDYILSIFDIEKKLETRPNVTIPEFTLTERPDKVSRALIEGRCALILNGSSHAIIMPTNITDIISSPEDAYLRNPYSVFIKIIRVIAILLSLLTPGIYLAITMHHTESILTNMLISILSTNSSIPFSHLTEVIIMELSFELIKEAGVRIPGAIGSSLGIVGGLILGQCAVSASLVSPIVIIIVSICGIASFAIPSYSLSFAFRISRFFYIFAGAIFGIIGVIGVFSIELCTFVSTKNFGVAYCVPFSPQTGKFSFVNFIFKNSHKKYASTYLNTVKEDVKNES